MTSLVEALTVFIIGLNILWFGFTFYIKATGQSSEVDTGLILMWLIINLWAIALLPE